MTQNGVTNNEREGKDCFSFFFFMLQWRWSAFSRSYVYSGILEAGVRREARASANGNIDTPLVSQWKHGHSTPVSQ